MNRQYGALSGIAIVLIVMNHAIAIGISYPVEQGFASTESCLRDPLTVLQALGAYAVPIFLFISGAFLTYAASRTTGLSIKFIYGGLRHIIWPYLFWSLVFYVLVFAHYQENFSILGYVKNILIGYPYHFVPLLIFWYLLSPLLIRFGKDHGLLILIIIGTYQLLLIVIREQDSLGVNLPELFDFLILPVLFGPMAEWAIYLPLGVVLSLNAMSVRPVLIKLRWLFTALTILIFAVAILNAYGQLNIPLTRYLVPLPFMFLMPIIKRNSIPLVRRFELIGKRSYGIYLMHLILIDLSLVLVEHTVTSLFSYVLLLIILLFAVGLAIPLWLMEVVARGPGRRYYRYVFG